MFCPACKAEYRPGFRHCPDCDVDLVDRLDPVPTNAIRQDDLDKPALLWTGTSGEAQAALCTALKTVNIPYLQRETDVGMIPGLAQPVFAIFVKGRDLDGAQLVLERTAEHFEADDSDANTERDDLQLQADARSLDPVRSGKEVFAALALKRAANSFGAAPTESSFADTDTADSAEPTPDDIAEDFIPENATQEVWSGADLDMAETVRLCLRENGIGCVVQGTGNEKTVLVTPGSEARAKEIVREIVSGAPST